MSVPADTVAKGGSWSTRAIDVLLLVVAAVMFVDLRVNLDIDDPVYRVTALLWIVLAGMFIAVRLLRMRRARRGDPHWARRLQDVRLGHLVVGTTALTVVNAITLLLAYTGDAGERAVADLVAQGGDPDLMVELVTIYSASALLLIVLAWAVPHLSYAERYARLWVLGRARGVTHFEFPGTATPTLTEFVYVAVTVGVAFATSDVSATTSEARSKMIFHGLLSFLYNAVIVAATVGVLTS
ncbi:DUF1345 domain-containing protein [Pseudonocardia sp. TRM90224]|uniref:DUF1345 domain-containing protein n=1 Tax=Pseudonocardia sp. TRM90224 TaxID=2812678 RepID=UPI001E4887A0|nr:DUF1345 domain-containing protein [Pseudonocardia sp. TRM90224]